MRPCNIEIEANDEIKDLKNLIEDIVKVQIDDFVVTFLDPRKIQPDIRARWKCMFGCDYYGKRKSCPPFVPDIIEVEKFLSSYRIAAAVKLSYSPDSYMETKVQTQKLLLELERKLIGRYPFVLTLFPGGCDLCEECDESSLSRCKDARPTVSSMGINISDLGVKIGDGFLVSIILID